MKLCDHDKEEIKNLLKWKKMYREGKLINMEETTKKLDWERIIHNVGKPVYDKKLKKWRVIDGYKRMENSFGVSFTDNDGFFNYNGLELYLEEVE